MGTRSTVKFFEYDNSEKPVLSVYQQFDGYIEGVGHELANWLLSKKVINGIQSGQTMEDGFANGIGCLSAQYVADHKTKIGGFYLTTDDDLQGYDYEVRYDYDKKEFIITVDNFKGTPQELLVYVPSEE